MGLSSSWNNSKSWYIPFTPYYGIKDFFGWALGLICFLYIAIITPDKLLHFDNFILANPLITPPHIVPEWYFLPLYGVLRSVTNKSLGIFLLALSIFSLFLIPFLCKGTYLRSTAFDSLYKKVTWAFIINCILLGWIGKLPIMSPFFEIGKILTFYYFFYIFIILPVIVRIYTVLFHMYLYDKKNLKRNFLYDQYFFIILQFI